jgi:hypothetical protein
MSLHASVPILSALDEVDMVIELVGPRKSERERVQNMQLAFSKVAPLCDCLQRMRAVKP